MTDHDLPGEPDELDDPVTARRRALHSAGHLTAPLDVDDEDDAVTASRRARAPYGI